MSDKHAVYAFSRFHPSSFRSLTTRRAMDFPRFIEQLKDKTTSDVVSKYVRLRGRKQVLGKVPFHHDKTPPLAVNVDGQFYHCFGWVPAATSSSSCEKGSPGLHGAVELLCKRAGMKLPNTYPGKDADEAQS